MKKLALLCTSLLMSITMLGQSSGDFTPHIAVNGTGKVSVTPDKVLISVGVENRGEDAAAVKKDNDAAVAKVIAFVKKSGVSDKDYQTQRVSLHKGRDYETKQDYYQATQTITISLKDITKYEALMVGLMEAGVNQIQGVEFQTSKTVHYQREARQKAVQDAKQKAQDYADALNQQLGKAILVSDQQASYPPIARPMMMKAYAADESADLEQTLAIGEIEIVSNVSISFELK